MNFYKHYIGDFQRDTGHLSLTERGAYLCLIHHYYATEKPLPADLSALCRIAGAITKPERDAVKTVMSLFQRVDSGLMHKRIEAELEKAGKRADTNREIALAREAKRREEREEHEQSTNRATNREPNQTPDTRHHNPPTPKGESDGFKTFWSEWPSNDRKGAKGKCAEAWRKQGCEEVARSILAHVARLKTSEGWTKQGGQFVPAPLVYLNQRRWEGAEADDTPSGLQLVGAV